MPKASKPEIKTEAAIATPEKPKSTRRTKASTTNPTTKKSRTTTKRSASPSKQVSDIEKRLAETEKRLNELISIIHNDLYRGQKEGPEGLAAKLRKAGLLS